MPRSLVLGNGNILVGLDDSARVQDFCFPYVGSENHIDSTNPHRVGVYVDSQLSWLNTQAWKIEPRYKKSTMVGLTQALNSELGVRLEIEDAVYNERNIFLRKIKVYNNRNITRLIKLFFNQEFQLYGGRWGNTAYFYPEHPSIVHYKARRVFLVSGRAGQASFDEYTTGLSRYLNYQGTYKDAEDGKLSGNPIEHGSVDSTIGFSLEIKARSYKTVYYWVAVGKDIEEVYALNRYVLAKTPQHLLRTTTDFWKAWVNKQNFNFHDLSAPMVEAFKRSLLIIRSQTDNHGGILASSDQDILQYGKDTYTYIWPRDAAYAVMALDKAGYFDLTQKFFRFILRVLGRQGYLMHKYNADGSLGSSWHPWVLKGEPILPIQADETAIVLYALWRHYQNRRDLELIEELYNPLIKKMADFLVSFKSLKFDLPQPSYDLWEERFGISTYTTAAIIGALRAAAFFSRLLGKTSLFKKYLRVAETYRRGLMENLYLKEQGYFAKALEFANGEFRLDPTPDVASVFGLVEFEVLPPDNQLTIKAVENTLKALRVRTPVGGLARYQGDHYFQVDPSLPGNPWFITTLWEARYLIRRAQGKEDLESVKKHLNWAVERALPSGLFSEQLHPYTGSPLSASPLTWSHAFYVLTVLEYLEKLSELGICDVCKPITLHFE